MHEIHPKGWISIIYCYDNNSFSFSWGGGGVGQSTKQNFEHRHSIIDSWKEVVKGSQREKNIEYM